MKRTVIFTFLLLSACASFRRQQWESHRSPLSQLGPLRVEVLGSQELTRPARLHSGALYESSPRDPLSGRPWQWRDRNAVGAPPQTLAAPVFLSDREALFMTLGGGLSRRNFVTHVESWHLEIPVGVAAKPYVTDDRVVVAGMDGWVRSLDLASGHEKWKSNILVESLGGISGLGGQLFVTGADNSLWCLREESGEVLWTYKRPAPDGPVIWSLRGQATPAVSLDAKTLFVGFSDGVFVALDALTGKTRWERRFERGGLFRDADTTPLILRDGRTVILSLVDGDLMALNGRDGSVLWTQKVGSFAAPYYDVDDNRLYVPGGDGRVHRLNAQSGVSDWTYDLGFKGLATQPALVAKNFIAMNTSHFGLVILDKATGKLVYQYGLGSGSTTPVAVRGQTLLALDSRNLLLRFKVQARDISSPVFSLE